ncbi:hypothetical protein BV911_10960 [Pseudoruegeria sp. SK021]|nr:hypothetical protein BV911_10960 [Pseudoruegeria sp. SK021]
MTQTSIPSLPDPSGLSRDPLTELLRSGARTLIQQAVEAELAVLLRAHAGEMTDDRSVAVFLNRTGSFSKWISAFATQPP